MGRELKKTLYGRHAEIQVFAEESLLSLKYVVYFDGSRYSTHGSLRDAVEVAETLSRER